MAEAADTKAYRLRIACDILCSHVQGWGNRTGALPVLTDELIDKAMQNADRILERHEASYAGKASGRGRSQAQS